MDFVLALLFVLGCIVLVAVILIAGAVGMPMLAKLSEKVESWLER